jgi:hypothetical protein
MTTCDRRISGLYGAPTICARPADHLGPHYPIHRYTEWPDPEPPRDSGEADAVHGPTALGTTNHESEARTTTE